MSPELVFMLVEAPPVYGVTAHLPAATWGSSTPTQGQQHLFAVTKSSTSVSGLQTSFRIKYHHKGLNVDFSSLVNPILHEVV